MRYFAGFIGGFVVALLLLVFQQNLIGAEREYLPQPSVDITLDVVPESRPPEKKPYEARTAPPKPEPLETPDLPVDPPQAVDPQPVLHDLPASDGVIGHGSGPVIRYGGGGIADGAAVVLLPVEPQYPPNALRAGVEGEVEVEFTVQADGSVTDAEVVRAEPRGVFEQSALRAIQRWQFRPKHENGRPVMMRARQVIRFELPDAQ